MKWLIEYMENTILLQLMPWKILLLVMNKLKEEFLKQWNINNI